MTDSAFFKGLALWFVGLVALALVAGSVVGVAVLSADRRPPPMDDLHVSNHDDRTHSVTVEAVPANGTDAVRSAAIRLDPGDRVSRDGVVANGRQYRLVVTVDDREPVSFTVEKPDDLCTIEVRVESNATVESATACA